MKVIVEFFHMCDLNFGSKEINVQRLLSLFAHIIDTSTSEVTLENVPVAREFSNVFLEDLPSLPLNRELDFVLIFCLEQLPLLYHRIG